MNKFKEEDSKQLKDTHLTFFIGPEMVATSPGTTADVFLRHLPGASYPPGMTLTISFGRVRGLRPPGRGVCARLPVESVIP
jgi:hypothetical protein